jgi:hypothetical protein
MLQSFKSAFLLMALEYILSKGLEFCKEYTEDNAKEVEAFVKKLIPGEDFDALGWSVVSMLLPQLFSIAATLIDKIDGIDSRAARMAEMVKAVRGIPA